MGVTNELLDVTFTNMNHGIIVGVNGTILITTNGGATWTIQLTSITDRLIEVTFTDSANGIVVGYNTILKTEDGGITWIPQEVITSNLLYSVSFTDVNNGWIVGARGTILHTTNGGVTFIEDEEDYFAQPKEFLLQQNYPNPFNPSTSIQYAISSTQFVTLKVYDLLGREVATLVNEEKPAGSYNAQFTISNLPAGRQGVQLSSGIYFYKLQAGDFIETKKMILLK